MFCNPCCNLFIPVQFNQFKEKIRVCRSCYDPLERAYQEHLNKEQEVEKKEDLDQEPAPNNNHMTLNGLFKNFTDTFMQTKTELEENFKSLAHHNHNSNEEDEFRPVYTKTKTSRVAIKRVQRKKASLQDSVQTKSVLADDDDSDSDSSNDEYLDADTEFDLGLSRKSEPGLLESIMSEVSSKSTLYQEQKEKLKPKLPLKPSKIAIAISIEHVNDRNTTETQIKNEPHPQAKSSSSTKLFGIKSTFKREPLDSVYGYLGKIPIEQDCSTDIDRLSSQNVKLERTCFVLYSDHTLGVASSHNELNNPNLVVHLSLFTIRNINETCFGLNKIKESNTSNISNISNIANSNSNEDDSSEKRNIGRLSNRLTMFELNYELKFTNKETKYVF